MSAPYVNFYTSDFLAGTAGMTAATKGVYITLLCMMYEREAPLPQPWDILARRCGATLPAFKKAVAALVDDEKIVIGDDGLWSPKCEKHIALRCDRRNSATASAKKRWEKTKGKQGQGDANAMRSECYPEPEPYVSAKALTDIVHFSAFWTVWPSKRAKAPAEKAWSKLKPDKRREAIEAVAGGWLDRWRECNPGASDIHAATFLNQQRWQDDVTAKGNAPRKDTSRKQLDAAMRAAARWDAERGMDRGPRDDPFKSLLPPGHSRGSRRSGDDGLDFGPPEHTEGRHPSGLRVVSF